jgi:hypothetical protein
MFSKNVMLFVATAVALGSVSAKGMPAQDLSLKLTAAQDIGAMETLTDENLRLEPAAASVGAVGGCVAIRDLPRGRVLEARDMICGGPTLGLRRGALDPREL